MFVYIVDIDFDIKSKKDIMPYQKLTAAKNEKYMCKIYLYE
jgi:hypothetical protein